MMESVSSSSSSSSSSRSNQTINNVNNNNKSINKNNKSNKSNKSNNNNNNRNRQNSDVMESGMGAYAPVRFNSMDAAEEENEQDNNRNNSNNNNNNNNNRNSDHNRSIAKKEVDAREDPAEYYEENEADNDDKEREAIGDVRPQPAVRLKLQHGTMVRVDKPMSESEFKRRRHIKESKYKQLDLSAASSDHQDNINANSSNHNLPMMTPGAKAGRARISAATKQTCLQYMLACAARREWSFWSTATFFTACWMNITLAAIDIVGESFGNLVNHSYNSTIATHNSTTVMSQTTEHWVYSESENSLYNNDGSVYNWVNVISCTLFVINPIFDWLYAFFNPAGYTTTIRAGACWQWLDKFAWGFWNPLWFFVASVFYLAVALDSIWNEHQEEMLILSIWASHLFIVDAVCALVVWRLGVIRARGTRDQVWLCSRHFERIDWCGWGDLLFCAGALLDSSNVYIYEVKTLYRLADRANFFGSILWTFDCVCYFFADKIANDRAKRQLKISRREVVDDRDGLSSVVVTKAPRGGNPNKASTSGTQQQDIVLSLSSDGEDYDSEESSAASNGFDAAEDGNDTNSSDSIASRSPSSTQPRLFRDDDLEMELDHASDTSV